MGGVWFRTGKGLAILSRIDGSNSIYTFYKFSNTDYLLKKNWRIFFNSPAHFWLDAVYFVFLKQGSLLFIMIGGWNTEMGYISSISVSG